LQYSDRDSQPRDIQTGKNISILERGSRSVHLDLSLRLDLVFQRTLGTRLVRPGIEDGKTEIAEREDRGAETQTAPAAKEPLGSS
jgi:hypothetical protein